MLDIICSYYFKVAWFGVEEITWEPASTLPQNLVDEFESGCAAEEVLHDSRYGVRSHTIIVPARQSEETPPAKKLKRTQWEKGYTLSCGITFLSVTDNPTYNFHY